MFLKLLFVSCCEMIMFQHFVCEDFLHFAFTALFNCCFAGCMKIKLKAWNILSPVEIDVDMPTACSNDADIKEVKYLPFFAFLFSFLNLLAFFAHYFFSCCLFFFNHLKKKKQIRFARSDPELSIVATPGNIIKLKTDITLSVTSSNTLSDSSKRYKWECSEYC